MIIIVCYIHIRIFFKITQVFQDLIKEYKWKEYAVLYDNADGLIRMNRLLKLPNLSTISAMIFHLGSGPNFRYACANHINKSFLIRACVHAQATFVKQSYYAPVLLFSPAVNARKYRDDLRYDCLDMKRTSLAQPHMSLLPRFFLKIRAI